jgi:glucose/arabinose dehydrogenase
MNLRLPLLALSGLFLVAALARCTSVSGTGCGTDSDCVVGNVCQSSRCVEQDDGGLGDGGVRDAGTDAGRDAGHDAGPADAGHDGGVIDSGPYDGGDISNPCTLSGSWVHDSSGFHLVGNDPANADGAPSDAADVYPGPWLNIPEGFCAHHFASVPNARQLRFAPGGELFVASPNTPTTGGTAGLSAIVILPDDNADGVADAVLHYKDGLSSTQGMMFANDSFYWQAGTKVVKQGYVSGQRTDPGTSQDVVNITAYSSALHWPKTFDISDNGTIYVGNGGDQGEQCVMPMPFHGGVIQVDGSAGGSPIVKGLRNPIDLKCHRDGHNRCFGTELARDYSASINGREKLFLIHPGDNWGFPCCATANSAFPDICLACGTGTVASGASSSQCQSQNKCSPDCSSVTSDSNSFYIGDTPFGFDFVDTQFPSPWDHKVIVALHGAFATWLGARVVAIDFDPATGLTYESTDIDGGHNEGHMRDFLTGWDNGQHNHGRPSDIAISSDGRVFVANDDDGEIFWIAPIAP